MVKVCLVFSIVLTFIPVAIAPAYASNDEKAYCHDFYDQASAKAVTDPGGLLWTLGMLAYEKGAGGKIGETIDPKYFPALDAAISIADKAPQCLLHDIRYEEMQSTLCLYSYGRKGFYAYLKEKGKGLLYCEQRIERRDDSTLFALVGNTVQGWVVERDFRRALSYIELGRSRLSPEKRDMFSVLEAEMYRIGGYGIEQNHAKSFQIMRELLKTGKPGPNCQLSLYYRDGIGTEKDEAKSQEYLKKYTDVVKPGTSCEYPVKN